MRVIGENQEAAPETGELPMTLWEKIGLVAKACSYIRKDGENQFHRYSYATAAAVYEKVNTALFDSGLVSVPAMRIESRDTKTNAKGGTEHIVTVECRLRIVDTASGESIETVSFGAGMDNGDKAVMKAQTAAMKYAWMDLLNISTGDDPEADEKVDSRLAGKPKDAPPPRGPKTGDFTAADKELARQAEVDRKRMEGFKCNLCDAQIGQFPSESKDEPGRLYWMCETAHAEQRKRRDRGETIAKAKAAIKGHYGCAARQWAEVWPRVKEREGAGQAETETAPQVAPVAAPAPPPTEASLEEIFRMQNERIQAGK